MAIFRLSIIIYCFTKIFELAVCLSITIKLTNCVEALLFVLELLELVELTPELALLPLKLGSYSATYSLLRFSNKVACDMPNE